MAVSVAEQEDLRHRERLGMRDRQQRGAGAHRIGPASGAAVQQEFRRATVADDLDILPQHAARVAGPERLHRRLLRREAPGDVRHGIAAAGTISNLAVGQNAAKKPVAVLLEHLADARDVSRVEPKPENIHGPSQA